MNISEANKLNVLLRWLVRPPGQYQGDRLPTTEEARAAAGYLADRASAALSAGLNGHQVEQLFPKRQPSSSRTPRGNRS